MAIWGSNFAQQCSIVPQSCERRCNKSGMFNNDCLNVPWFFLFTSLDAADDALQPKAVFFLSVMEQDYDYLICFSRNIS